ncbi:DUF2167 domain-containing protein [Pseudoduganella armeniaca]|uniref:DUF2167 domain-containing protein n=1 Tax=Pseudoduganella armeniaca TaxID=2072590 RepID=A0A2R4CGI3_9BURK|nr:DUF2167 domain-containing protein [Pseudoduganella armeniaca]
MLFRSLLCAVFSLLLAAAPVQAADTPPEQLLASLKFQEGKIALPGGIATLDLPAGFRYLPPADAGRLLSEGWGNPPGIETLGMIVPTAVNPLTREGWGVVVTYEKEGHVKDDDADSIKYDELLKTMQESMKEANEERKKQGYEAMTLVGWAEAPHYDKASHKLYWAKELHSEGDKDNGLNYNIRVLGREGVLVLNAVANMDQIAQIRKEMKTVTAFSDFTPGNRYADFNEKTDKVAEYGLAALVAGGAAAKLGLFGKLFALLLAFKKLIVVGIGALGVGVAKLFGRKLKVDLSKS